MFRYALKSLRANLTRLVATSLAIVLGIGFLAAGLMLTDAVKVGLLGNVEQRYENIDLAVVADTFSSDTGLLQGVQEEDLAKILATPGIAAAAGEMQANVRVLRADGTAANLRTIGRNWIDDEAMNPLRIIEGTPPAADDEMVLSSDLADQARVEVGDKAEVETPSGPMTMTVSGISVFGDQDAMDEGGTASFAQSSAVELLQSNASGFDDIIIRTEGSPGAVISALRETLPRSFDVLTRDEFVSAASDSTVAFVDVLRPVLQGFAYLAMFVSAFVIFNTFSVVVTQRFRELALIRAIGGTPAQVRRSLLVEGLGIGLGASVVGVIAGAALAKGLQAILGAFDLSLPGSGVKVTAGTVVLCLVVGTAVTFFSVLIPAFRAGRTKPVEAMRASAVDNSGTSTARAVIGGTMLGLGLALLIGNRLGGARWYLLAPGSLLLFLGVFVGGPLLARLFARIMRSPLSALGLTGRVAADNVVRNPKRTATTANALVIGLFLVTLVTVSGEAMKTSIVDELNKLSSSDFILMSNGAIAPDLVKSVDGIDGVSATAPIRSTMVLDDQGQPQWVSAANLDRLADTAGLTVKEGSGADVRSGKGMAIPDFSELGGGSGGGPGQGFRLGDIVHFRAVNGETISLPVSATLDAKLDSFFLGYVVSPETFKAIAGDKPVNQVFVRVDPGQADAVGRRLEKAIAGYTEVEVAPGNFIGQIVGTIFDFLIGAVNALLAMSVVVALVGIVNTMTLSIFERRRELGLVRALGMTRRQVGRMVRMEAFLMGMMGTIIGVVTGTFLSWIIVSSIGDGAIELSFNYARVGLIVVVGLAVGVLAAILPARRATRIDMLDAIRDE